MIGKLSDDERHRLDQDIERSLRRISFRSCVSIVVFHKRRAKLNGQHCYVSYALLNAVNGAPDLALRPERHAWLRVSNL